MNLIKTIVINYKSKVVTIVSRNKNIYKPHSKRLYIYTHTYIFIYIYFLKIDCKICKNKRKTECEPKAKQKVLLQLAIRKCSIFIKQKTYFF